MKAAAGVLMLLAGCGAPRSYMGLDLTGPVGSMPDGLGRLALTALTARARDKAAQLELAGRFEDGRGVPADPDRACRLYEAAATTTGGTMWIYSPPVVKGGSGRVIPITTPVSPGLPAAHARLIALACRAGGQRGASRCLIRHRATRPVLQE